jgi:hypothetical protein
LWEVSGIAVLADRVTVSQQELVRVARFGRRVFAISIAMLLALAKSSRFRQTITV